MKKPFAFAIFLIYFIFLLCPRAECGTDTTIKGTTASSAQNSLDVTNSADTSLLTVRNDGRVNIGGPLGILESGSSPSFFTIFAGGDQSASITYTLPITSSDGFLQNTSGVLSWGSTAETDGVIGNEVTDAANATLTRSGAGTAVSPYKLAINLGNANTWAAAQTFDSGATISTLTLTNPLAVAQGGTGTATGSITGTGALAFAAGGSNQNLSLAPSGTGSLALNGPAKLSSTLSLLESGSTPTKYTIFAGGDQTTDITYTLPTTSANGFLRNTDGVFSWQTPTAAPGGSNTQVQFNDNGALGGDAGFVYNSGTTTATIATLNLTNDLAVTEGGTGASTAANARTNLGVAASGANSDITSLSALSTALSVAQGGTGTATGSITGTGALAFTAGGTNQNLAIAGSGTGKVVSNSSFGILEGGASPSKYTIFAGGDQSADITYTLPTSSTNGTLTNTGGVLSWEANGAEVDGVIGNEVTDAANATLTRSGAGTSGDPYKLAINLGNANTWAGTQTFGTASADTLTLTNPLGVAQGGTGTATGSITGTGALAFAAGGTNQNLSLAGSGTGNVVSNSSFGIREGGASPSFYTLFAGGDQSGNITYTLPTTSANGFLRNNDGVFSWQTPTAAPGGSNTQVQFNDNGALGGSSGFIYNSGTTTATIATLNLTNDLAVTEGGTGASTASGARTSLGAAASGANSDITSLSALSTALSVAQGGTGTATGSITGTGALAFAAGGTNQNVTLTPSGTGSTVLNSTVSIPSMSSAGFLKNTAAGLLSGGNSIAAADIPRSDLVNGTGISMGGTLTNRLVGSGDNVTVNVGSTVPTSVVNDTNVTGSLASNALTLGWTGQLALTRGGTGASTQSGAANNILPSQTGNSGKFLTTNGTDASWGTSSGTDTDKMHIKMFSVQSAATTKSTPGETISAPGNFNIGTTPIGFGSAAIARMDGFTTVRLMMIGANNTGQSGTVTVTLRNFTDSTDLVSLTFSDTTVQFREATASIALADLKRLGILINSTVANDDPLIGDVAIQLEK